MSPVTLTVYLMVEDDNNPKKWNVAELIGPEVVGWNVEHGHGAECAGCNESHEAIA